MAKSKKSNRGRGKSTITRKNSRPPARKRQPNTSRRGTNKRAKPPDKSSSETSTSQTSPFKGFDDSLCSREGDLQDSQEQDKENAFDKLVSSNYSNKLLNRNIKTYSNRNRNTNHSGLLQFQDRKNREVIIQWLSDSRNAFERLTQTETDCYHDYGEFPLTLDIPSVSQVNQPKLNTSHINIRRRCRSPYKLRARSLDIRIKKNKRSGRNTRHSLAGDTPELENYHIEEVLTDEDVSIPAKKDAKIIIDLMEDAYLNSIESEIIQQQNEKKSKSFVGWERIRIINKTINDSRQHPKQLNVTFQMQIKGSAKSGERDTARPNHEIDSIEELLEVTHNLLVELKKLASNNDKATLQQFEPLINECKSIFQTSNNEKATQTDTVTKSDRDSQVIFSTTCVETQTEYLYACQNCAIKNDNVELKKATCDKDVQTVANNVNIEVQTNSDDTSLQKNSLSATGSSTPELIFDQMEKIMTDREQDNFVEAFDNVNTEDMLQKHAAKATVANCLTVFPSDNKGVKRPQRESPLKESEKFRPKRPCSKFIKDDLSIGFETCTEHQDGGGKDKEAVEVSDEIEDININECLDKVFKKYEDTISKVDKPLSKSRTQEQIDLNYFKPLSYGPSRVKSPRKSRRELFQSKEDSTNELAESLFVTEHDAMVSVNKTLTKDNVNIVENDDCECDDEEVQRILSRDESKINILQNIVITRAGNPSDKNDECGSEASDDVLFSDIDVVDGTPQKKFSSRSEQRVDSALDVTLPPPLKFQDWNESGQENDVTLVKGSVQSQSPVRRPLAVINKITSTPISRKVQSESLLSLSPISAPKDHRVLGPIELAQKAKFSPLTIVRKPPSQKSQHSFTTKQKSILNYVISPQNSQNSQQFNSSISSQVKKPCIACSRITSKEQVIAISSMTNKKLATYSTSFTSKVTHLIVSVNEKNFLKDHTIKFVSAVAAGIWVLNFGWIQECLATNKLVDEKPYEVLDVSGEPGPQHSRLTRLVNPLLKGFKIHAARPFVSITQAEIENVVQMLGGKVVSFSEDLLEKQNHICLIVTEAKSSQDYELYETWLEALKVVTVDIEWLCRSVGQYKVLSLRPFTLCSDDTIENLGYPPELVTNMQFSFSQQTFSVTST